MILPKMQRISFAFARLLAIIAVFAGGFAAAPARKAQAAALVVTTLADSGSGSLRQAILTANDTPGADTITVNVTGILYLDSPLPVLTGSLEITGPGADLFTVAGNVPLRPFQIAPGATVTLAQMKIIGSGSNEGYAVLNEGNLTLSQAQIDYGGGLAVTAIQNLVGGTLTVIETKFALGVSVGIYNYGTAVTIHSTFENTRGIVNDDGVLSVIGCTFHSASSSAGGIYSGGGLVGVANSTFDSGASALPGSDIDIESGGWLVLTNTTSVSDGNSIYIASGGIAVIKNTILQGCPVLEAGVTVSGGINLSTGDCGGVFTQVSAGALNLGPVQNNGGLVFTAALLPGSAAIDAGDAAACSAEPVANVDGRGIPRPYGPACDIGAFERRYSHAQDDEYVTHLNTPVAVDAAHGLLANDSNPDGSPLQLTPDTFRLQHGLVVLHADGSFTYEPDSDFIGGELFAYIAHDGAVDSNSAAVTITVRPAEVYLPLVQSN